MWFAIQQIYPYICLSILCNFWLCSCSVVGCSRGCILVSLKKQKCVNVNFKTKFLEVIVYPKNIFPIWSGKSVSLSFVTARCCYSLQEYISEFYSTRSYQAAECQDALLLVFSVAISLITLIRWHPVLPVQRVIPVNACYYPGATYITAQGGCYNSRPRTDRFPHRLKRA